MHTNPEAPSELESDTLTTHFMNPDDPIAEYSDQPLIGALGMILDENERIGAMLRMPAYREDIQSQPAHLRAHAVRALSELFIPMIQHERAMQEVDILLRRGYLHRNPLSEKYRRHRNEALKLLKGGTLPAERYSYRPHGGAAMWGPPGTGKTTAANMSLSQYPSIVRHAYMVDGARLAFIQVVAITINLFQDASLKGFAIEFFEQLSRLLGDPKLPSRWGIDSRQLTANTAQPLIHRAIIEYHVGMIVVDDSQNMVSSHQGHTAVLDYFVRIMNCLGVPVLLIGTESTAALVSKDTTYGRRFLCDIPPFAAMRPKERKDDPDGPWEIFLDLLWRYQYTRTRTDHRLLASEIWRLTGGVPDLVVKLCALAQARSFGRKSEQITEAVLRETSDQLFATVADRILELKARRPDDPGIGVHSKKLDLEFRRLMNTDASRVGCQPLFPEAALPPVHVQTNVPAETSADKNAQLDTEPDAHEPEPKYSVSERLEQLRKSGKLELFAQ